MHIGLLVSELGSYGGVQSYMLRLIDALKQLTNSLPDTNVSVFSLNDSPRALHERLHINPRLSLSGATRHKTMFVSSILSEPNAFDVLIVGHLNLSPVAYALTKARRAGRYFVLLHGIEAWQRASFAKRVSLNGAETVVATTNYTATRCSEANRISLARFSVIPLCAPALIPASVMASPLQGGVKLLCVARQDATEKYKGFESIFRALKTLSQSNPDVHLNLAGSGNDQPRLKNIVNELNIKDRVTFLGALSDTELADAYDRCDVFVLPSAKEGFGIVFLEAMHRGKPCIGGNHGGIPEVIVDGQTGFLVEYDDHLALADRIKKLAENRSLRDKLGAQGAERVRTLFNFDRFANSFTKLVMNQQTDNNRVSRRNPT